MRHLSTPRTGRLYTATAAAGAAGLLLLTGPAGPAGAAAPAGPATAPATAAPRAPVPPSRAAAGGDTPAGKAGPVSVTVPRVGAPQAPLTNLAHLNFLGGRIAPPAQARHTTYQLATDPRVGVLWVYATPDGRGSFTRVGGGVYDRRTRSYGQGAYDADDMARAAVVYLRHWRQFGDPLSRARARNLLRGLTYLQDATGPHAGNVVLWMQPDGRLNPTPTPADTPNPADSGASYWLARTAWALGEGYAAFRAQDPGFGRFLAAREDLAVRALDRQVLRRYPRTVVVDGRHRPSWLITGGADATAEAVLGLTAYVDAGGGPTATGRRRARTAIVEFSRGIAAMAAGDAWTWPYGAILPAVTSVSQWHAWAGLAPAALAASARTLRDPRLLGVAQRDAVTFTSHLLVQGGPDNNWAPTPVDRSQIAYGADSRVEDLQTLTDLTHQPGTARLTGLAASWFFGDDRAHRAVYNPRTGVTDDGIAPDGTVNTGSGAESTIHGLLTMLALDRDPTAAAVARAATVTARVTGTVLEAEGGGRTGNATVVTPPDASTGESQWSGGGYVDLHPGSRLTLTAEVPAGTVLMAVTRYLPGSAATRWTVDTRPVGTVHQGRIGAQGVSPWPGALEVTTLPAAPAGHTITVTTLGRGTAAVDAVLVQPKVELLRLRGGPGRSGATVLLRSFADRVRTVRVPLTGAGAVTLDVFGPTGRLLRTTVTRPAAGSTKVELPAGGTALLTRL